MTPRVQHIVETRFSLRPGREAPRFAPGWLQERLELLRRFCLPSMAAQTADSIWLVLCDEATDPDVVAELRAARRILPTLRIGLTSAARDSREVVLANVRPDTDVLITTQLDSDDALANDYLVAVQGYADCFHRSSHADLLVNFPRGYRLDTRETALYEERMANSSFHSLFERPRCQAVDTVLRRSRHATLRQEHVTHQDESMHGWLIVVHGGNVVNRIRPESPRVDLQAGLSGFTLADGIAERQDE